MINIDNILSMNMPTNFPIIKILIEQSEYKHYNVRKKKKNGQLSAYKREKKRKIINNYMNDNFLLMFL